MIASDANSNNINKSSESSQLSNFEENRCEQNQAASSDEKIEEVEAEESDEEEADDSGEIEDSPKIQESQPSLTPTPPTPTDEQFSRKSTESKATASRGPALSAIENDEEDTEEEEIEFNRTVKVYDQFNPELEYLSDPDYHDDRPTKKKRVKGIKSDKSEYNTGDEEYKTSDEELEVETNGFLHDQEAAPLSIHFELGLESPERSSPIAIPEAETSGDERLTVIAKSDSEEESRGIIGELDDQQVAPDEVETAADDTSSSETLELDNQGLTGVSEGNSKVECELSGSDSSEEVSPSSLQVYQSEVFNCVISETNNNQEDQTATELPVTASEAQAELFVDESTLADSNLVDLKSKSSTDFSRVEDQDNNPEEEDSLNETRADELITDEPTPVPDQDQQIGSHLKGRQQSLEDVDATVLDQVDAECVEKIEEDDEEKRKRMLIELIENYCESLVEMIKDEALKQIELISKTSGNVNNLILSNAFEIVSDYSSNMNVQIDSNSQRTTSTSKKVYTSSMYYNDNQNSFPTIGQQVERCRTIAKQLEEGLSEAEEQGQDEPVLNANDEFKSLSPLIEPVKANLSIVEKLDNRLTINNDSSRVGKSRRASQMFKLRRERMNDFTLDNSVDSDMDNDDSVREKPTSVSSKLKNRLQKSATLANCSRVIVGVNSRRQSVDFYGPTTDGEADPNYDTSIYYEEKGTEDLAAVTDTEYEAPKVRRRALPTRATTTPFSERRRRHVEVNNEANESRAKKTSGQDKPKYKPFLDSSTLKDIEKLRAWSPYGEFNEHNSVSPEVCSKLVQDMRSSCDGGQVHINGTNKGAKLFSRRQLQSSDWIVTSDDSNNQVEQEAECKISLNGTRLDSSTEDDSNCRNESISESEIDDSKLSVDRRHLSRPSLSEETTLIVDANDDYCASVPVTCELASVVSQPELELATITKTPSFSTSSWRVIESDSPDLLGHQEDEVKEEYAATIRVEGDEVDTDSNEASESDLVSQKSELTESKATSLNLLEVGEEAVVAAKARPLSRTGELHQATLLEWRPHVAPPTWMSTTGAHIKSSSQSSSLLNEAHASSSRKRCTSLTHDIEPSSSTTAATTKTVGEVQEQRASVASLRDSYQTLIEDELAGNKYRSYHHRPFGQQAASSLNDRDEYFSTPPLSLSPQPPMVEQPPDQLSSDLRPQQQGRRKGSQQPPGWFPSWRPDQLARYHSVPPELRPTARRDVYLSASPIGPEPAAGQANELGLCTCHAPCRVHHSSTSIINSGTPNDDGRSFFFNESRCSTLERREISSADGRTKSTATTTAGRALLSDRRLQQEASEEIFGDNYHRWPPVGVFGEAFEEQQPPESPALETCNRPVPTWSELQCKVAYGPRETSDGSISGDNRAVSELAFGNLERRQLSGQVSHAQDCQSETHCCCCIKQRHRTCSAIGDYQASRTNNNDIAATAAASDNWPRSYGHSFDTIKMRRPPTTTAFAGDDSSPMVANYRRNCWSSNATVGRYQESNRFQDYSALRRTEVSRDNNLGGNRCSSTSEGCSYYDNSLIGERQQATPCKLRVLIKLPDAIHQVIVYRRPELKFATTIEQ